MEAYAIISIQTASPALDFQCLVFLTDELKTQLLHMMLNFLFLYKFFIHSTIVRQGETTKLGYFLDWYYSVAIAALGTLAISQCRTAQASKSCGLPTSGAAGSFK